MARGEAAHVSERDRDRNRSPDRRRRINGHAHAVHLIVFRRGRRLGSRWPGRSKCGVYVVSGASVTR